MTEIVTARRVHSDAKPDWRIVTTSESEYIVFNAQLADALEIDKPLPEGTEKQPPKFEGAMPALRLPFAKKFGGGGGAAAWRNTKEGAAAERESIHRSVALTQAVLAIANFIHIGDERKGPADVLATADLFYEWLSSSQPPLPAAGNGGGLERSAIRPPPPTQSRTGTTSGGRGGRHGTGEAAAGSATSETSTASPGAGSTPGRPLSGNGEGGGAMGKRPAPSATSDELWGGMGLE